MSYMERALALAWGALGSVSPNPAVGAVVVKDGRVVGEGRTQAPGRSHAEIVALRQAGEDAAGTVLYTTLEPCCHFGRTPPCTDAIIASGISEVRSAVADPNPLVSGKGHSALRDAGIRTVTGEGEAEATKVMEAYFKFITTGLPFVIAKFAMSLDGKIATRTGDSRWISGEESRRYAHRLRATSDAVMVGVNTVIADDPRLTARDDSGEPRGRQPLRVVVDSRGRTPAEARLLSGPGRTVVAVAGADAPAADRLSGTGAEVERVEGSDGRVDLAELLSRLALGREITSLLVEGGGTLLGSLFDQRLVDKVVAFVAPAVIGGRDAPAPVGGTGVQRAADAFRLQGVEVLHLGADVAMIGYL